MKRMRGALRWRKTTPSDTSSSVHVHQFTVIPPLALPPLRNLKIQAFAEIPDFLPSDWMDSKKDRPLGPRLDFTAEAAVKYQLDALRNNDQPQTDHGIEIMYRFTDFDPFERSKYFGRPRDLGQFEEFKRIFHSCSYGVLVNHSEIRVLSSLYVKENVYKQRVWVRGARTEEAETFEFTMVQKVGGSWDGYWLTDSLVLEGDGG